MAWHAPTSAFCIVEISRVSIVRFQEADAIDADAE
jgi:hypothetical protein